MSETRSNNLPKRFYQAVAVVPEAGGHAVRLDDRAVRTPGRRPLIVPRRSIAQAIAAEWEAQGEVIDPATMPATRLANTTLDGIADDPGPLREDLKRYSETDLLFYRAEDPERLVERQSAAWNPVLEWAETHVGGLFRTAGGVMHVAQPPETLAAFARRFDREDDPFVLAALHQITTLTGSLILALAVRERHLTPLAAWKLAHLEEDWNIELWGSDAEAEARRESRKAELLAAALMLEAE